MTLAAVTRRDRFDPNILRNTYYDAQSVTPANDTALAGGIARAIYVGGTGDLTVTTEGGSKTTFKAVPVGTLLPIRVQSVESTNTTATQIVALF